VLDRDRLPKLEVRRLVMCVAVKILSLMNRGRRVAREEAVMASPHSMMLQIARSVKL
jgi:hypothetical protein